MRTSLVAAVAILVGVTLAGCGPTKESSGSATNPAQASASKPPFGFLNTPAEGQTVDPAGPPVFGTGWALADSGVAGVSVVFDNGQPGFVKTGFPFPGVKEQFPNYADADKAGYMFAIPKLPAGPHLLTVTVTAKDGGTTRIERHFSMP